MSVVSFALAVIFIIMDSDSLGSESFWIRYS